MLAADSSPQVIQADRAGRNGYIGICEGRRLWAEAFVGLPHLGHIRRSIGI